MMKTGLNIHIYPRAAKANAAGLFPIYVRFTLTGKRSEFSTGKFIDPAKWDEKTMRIKGNTEEARTINSYLESIRNKITQMQIHFQFQESEVTIDQFMNLLLGKKTERERMLIPIFEDHNKRVKDLEKLWGWGLRPINYIHFFFNGSGVFVGKWQILSTVLQTVPV